MSRHVLAVRPQTSCRQIARLMTEHRIGALPVVDVVDSDGRIVGIVSQADVLRAERRQAEVNASSVMTSPVVTVQASASLAEAAAIMRREGVRRLPVVDEGGRLVGIVSRGDLVRVFARSDESLRREIEREIRRHLSPSRRSPVRVTVADGVVTLEGEVETESAARMLDRVARDVAGVVGVNDRLVRSSLDVHVRGREAAQWRR